MERAILECAGKKVSLPVLRGTDGTVVINVATLYREHGLLTYDPGFMSTAACSSEITYIDGDAGILRHRGIDIADLIRAEGGFCQVAYLLFHGAKPDAGELTRFTAELRQEYDVHEDVKRVIQAFPITAHPMAVLMASFSALAALYHGNKDNMSQLDYAMHAVAKVPGVIALIYRHINGLDEVSIDRSLGYVQHFVNMMFGSAAEQHNDVICRALEAIFITHADHEQNASTATVRMSGSAGAGLFACLSAGTATLWGPAHGGANEAVIKMLEEIRVSGSVNEFITKVKSSESKVKLMGFGHRVYRNYDPRALILKEICAEVLSALGKDDELLHIAHELEQAALADEYFIERKLYPNVDFYSGIVLRAIGVPVSAFTTMFALARTAGWSAQWYEMMNEEGGVKICRPRQLYMGK